MSTDGLDDLRDLLTLGPPRVIDQPIPYEVVTVPPIGQMVEDDDDEEALTRHLKVYRAEDKAAAEYPGEPLDGTLRAAQRYVDRIVRSAWWKRTCPKVTRVEVRKGRQGGGYALYGAPVIRLGHGYVHAVPAIADPWVILHELGHLIAIRQGHRGHGREFARCYLLLVDRWLGKDAGRALRAAYAAEGMKYRAKRVATRGAKRVASK